LLQFKTSGRAAAIPSEVYEQVVGNIAHSATAEGQLQLALPMEWKEVNFAHVPVGLLSEVYEAFAHDEDADAAKRDSIFYTPRHIAEFMVEEALGSLEGIEHPTVLDPAAGAGVFLVAVFRALVARAWTRTGRRPTRRAVRRILEEQLTGFDINDSALRLAELALYLTAIELDPEDRPRPLSLLKFEKPLRDKALFQRVDDQAEARRNDEAERSRWSAEGVGPSRAAGCHRARVGQGRRPRGARHARRFAAARGCAPLRRLSCPRCARRRVRYAGDGRGMPPAGAPGSGCRSSSFFCVPW
jgi:N-6 DNA Methylase